MTKINLDKIKFVHFIGIGGIGVSALARMMLERGKKVSGSDTGTSRITEELQKLGAKVFVGHKEGNISKKTDLVIYTIAITDENPEFKFAKKNKITSVSYPEFLGIISKDYFTIAISGTHGKTTTTAMVSDVLWNEGVNPTVIVGSLLKKGGSNFIAGDSPTYIFGKEWNNGVLLVEACEYRRSFINLYPQILIITNIDNDHLDYYKNIGDIISAFNEIAKKIPESGVVIANLENENIKKALRGVKAQIVDYSLSNISDLNLSIGGKHNIENAKAVLALVGILRADMEKAKESLSDFSGTWRRFEYKGQTKRGAIVYDDYGHHPTEIKVTLQGAREKFPDRKIIVIFQPHLYSRTKILLKDFASAFGDADKVILAPIYASREKFDSSVNSEMIRDGINTKKDKAVSFANFLEIDDYLKESLEGGEVLITMGAGDIHKVGEALII